MSKRKVIGDADYSIDLVVEQVKASDQVSRLGNRLEKLCHALELPKYVGNHFQRMYSTGRESTAELLVQVLEEWTYKRANGAYLEDLMTAFEKIKLTDIRDKLGEMPLKPDSSESQPPSPSETSKIDSTSS